MTPQKGLEYFLTVSKLNTLYRDEIYSLQNLLSRTQAGPGRTVNKEQEEISTNHVIRINLSSVHFLCKARNELLSAWIQAGNSKFFIVKSFKQKAGVLSESKYKLCGREGRCQPGFLARRHLSGVGFLGASSKFAS